MASAIADAIRWAEEIMKEIDRRHPAKPTPAVEPKPGNLVDYEKDKTRIIDEGYDIVREL